jgi:hypothetical protein
MDASVLVKTTETAEMDEPESYQRRLTRRSLTPGRSWRLAAVGRRARGSSNAKAHARLKTTPRLAQSASHPTCRNDASSAAPGVVFSEASPGYRPGLSPRVGSPVW